MTEMTDFSKKGGNKFNLNYYKSPMFDIQDFKVDSILEETFSEMDMANMHSKKHLAKPSDKSQEPSVTISPYEITNFQKYNPMYSQFFELSQKNYNQISLNHKYHICSLNQVANMSDKTMVNTPVFVKFSPLLDPIRYMIGKYDIENGWTQILPEHEYDKFDKSETYSKDRTKIIEKMTNPLNASYVDAFFSFLTSVALNEHGVIHGVDFYGSFLGVQKRFKVNIEDDLEYLANSEFFNAHVGKIMTVVNPKDCRSEFANFGSKNNKDRLKFNTPSNMDELILDIEDLENDETNEINVDETEEINVDETELQLEYMKSKSDYDSNSDSDSSENSSNNSKSNNSTVSESKEDAEDAEDAWETESDNSKSDKSGKSGSEKSDSEKSSEYSESNDTFAYIHDFPVQMICQEKCHGTFDDLFVKEEINPFNGASALFQIIMTLIIYQKMFDFTHNDLHTNNIMYINTDVQYLYYVYGGKQYRVPTYGKIFKIIDFGRAIYKFQGRQLCSDSFAPGGDAATQYNCEPFMNQKKPRLEPNPSFDLCRLACSIFDFIIDREEMDMTELDDFQRIIYRWCLDDNGKNILYKRTGEDRYPNFKLYKMIARTVHGCVPEEQLELPMFSQFLQQFDATNQSLNIDELPVYA